MKFQLQLLGSILAISQLAAAFLPPAVFENTAFSQSFDVSGSYVRKSVSISAKNVDSAPQNEYFYAISIEDEAKTSIIEARMQSTDAVIKVEVDEDWIDQDRGLVYHKLTFPIQLAAGENINFVLAQAFVDAVKPLPESAAQGEKQMLVFNGSKLPVSPYKTKSAVTRLKTRPGTLEEVTKEEDDVFAIDNSLSIWGPYTDVEPFSTKPLIYRFEYAAPLPKITKLQRDIWISHWGSSISFEETYWLKNIGTSIKGAFSRLDFQKSFAGVSSLNSAAIRDVRFFLPPNSRDVYYTDLVGNVSTSRFTRSDFTTTELEIKPRYPVFGGWGYNFTVGWSNNADQYLKLVDADQYLLKVPFLDGPTDIPYGQVDISIILPEGANSIEVLPPGGTDIQVAETYSYLDTVGRPTFHLSYTNLVDSHRRGFIYVSYTYSTSDSLRKPLTVAATIAAVFLVALLVSKVDLRIEPGNSKSEHVSTRPEPVSTKSESVSTRPEPVSAKSESVSSKSESVSSKSEKKDEIKSDKKDRSRTKK